jgi:hypothetical protein
MAWREEKRLVLFAALCPPFDDGRLDDLRLRRGRTL